MGYQQGLSGLAASSNDLDVIGNNIANANTVGFKQSTAQFADVYANTIATSVNTQIGLGAALSEVQQNFSQGTITTTGQALDVAINGNGFFQMSNNGTVTYSRNGVFQLNKSGYITDAAGNDLMGYAADSTGVVNTAQTVPIQVPTTNIAPVTTSNITAQVNLNAQSTTPTATPFSETDSNTYNYSTSVTAYDSLGGKQQVNMYFVKDATSGQWDVYAGTTGNATEIGTMTYDSSGNLTGTTDAAGVATTLGQLSLTINPTDGSATNQKITLDVTGSTQYGSANGVNNLDQDGYPSGTLSNFSIGADGTITGNYSNGQTMTLGQIVLANFNNPNGLQNLGGNQFAATSASGVAQVSVPGSTNHGTLTGGAVESSNVDLTNQLVDLITAQRNYQANAQTIKTQQTVDQTLLQM
ncbi:MULTISPECIES: flagellar hook protein FlgE [Paraburkholderia]|uniref:Flagellar hook protein FlgE n=1 Tax=Paraburkholderia tropica TaxID=92647 RepID=A0A1A5X134_9BURK|nr:MULTISPECIES: flagellar hook protein FlgE [Paraburkholderia]MBB2977871.1 flagellar hook protein FlgE [Paraburkholderia tropica]MBB2998443.1 flagellar hook protein FlgE [Paraburkholderia tropica]MBB6317485.1 flagellar hook protein FlgE [Paraburkholderia tropica]MDE1142549.1 flagellar hook protein FlgE [Paraburkholderia tropica]OBR46773.1 flagellar biosynthesis protein FlgE [Paraburkholderia tropica]